MYQDLIDLRSCEITIPGLQREYHFIHITDAHVLLYDENETQTRADYAFPRIGAFGKDCVSTTRRMDALWQYTLEHAAQLDGVLLTGDLIDFPSAPNMEYLRQKLEQLPVPYVFVLGNHDWAYFDDYHTPHSKVANRPLFHAWSGGNTFVHKQKIGELTFVCVDDTQELYEDGVAETLAEQLAGEENVLLMQHIPLCADTLHDDTVAYWHGRDINIGETGIQKNDNWQAVRQMILAEDSPVRALITGHLHFWHHDLLDGRMPQFVTAAAAYGGAALFTVHG